jgi:hypothetical protein
VPKMTDTKAARELVSKVSSENWRVEPIQTGRSDNLQTLYWGVVENHSDIIADAMEEDDAKFVAAAPALVLEMADEIDRMRDVATKTAAALASFLELYGTNLQVAGYHQNGEYEPFDAFIDHDDLHGALKTLQAVLGKEGEPDGDDRH